MMSDTPSGSIRPTLTLHNHVAPGDWWEKSVSCPSCLAINAAGMVAREHKIQFASVGYLGFLFIFEVHPVSLYPRFGFIFKSVDYFGLMPCLIKSVTNHQSVTKSGDSLIKGVPKKVLCNWTKQGGLGFGLQRNFEGFKITKRNSSKSFPTQPPVCLFCAASTSRFFFKVAELCPFQALAPTFTPWSKKGCALPSPRPHRSLTLDSSWPDHIWFTRN